MNWPMSKEAQRRRRRRLYPATLIAAVLVLLTVPVTGFNGTHLVAAVVTIFVLVAVAIETNQEEKP